MVCTHPGWLAKALSHCTFAVNLLRESENEQELGCVVAGSVFAGTLPTNFVEYWVSMLGFTLLAVAPDVVSMSGCCAAVGAACAVDAVGAAVTTDDGTVVASAARH